jgi:hypothetical protein
MLAVLSLANSANNYEFNIWNMPYLPIKMFITPIFLRNYWK